MAQTLFGSTVPPATNSLPNLDANFTQLFSLRELLTTPAYTAGTSYSAYTGANAKLTFGASWQLGLGVTPAAWGFGTALQVGAYAAIAYDGAGVTTFTSNAYYSAGWKYISSDVSTRYMQLGGAHYFSSAASGTGGNAITFVNYFILDTSGKGLFNRTNQQSGGQVEIGGNLVLQPAAGAPTLGVNGDMSFQLVSNTSLKILVRGSDGTTRSVTLTLA